MSLPNQGSSGAAAPADRGRRRLASGLPQAIR